MSEKLVSGCATVASQADRELKQRLVEIFAPELRFDPNERFYPVDVESTVMASSLYRWDLTRDPPWIQERSGGGISPPDMENATPDHFLSVAPLGIRQAPKGPAPQLTPQIDAIETLHANRTIASKGTIYGEICKLTDVPNAHFFTAIGLRNEKISAAVKDGYLLSYYFFFPAAFSADKAVDYEAEGDWSGISLLFRELPTQQTLHQTEPLLCCYFRKSDDYYLAGHFGFARWSDVEKARNTDTGYFTRPVVYVSRGRHNCYYKPQENQVPHDPWSGADTESIEGGLYTPDIYGSTEGFGTQDQTVPLVIFMLTNPLSAILQVICSEMGCPDASRLERSYTPATDVVAAGGHMAQPARGWIPPGSDVPPWKTSARGNPTTFNITPVLVDVTDAQIRDAWAFKGRWGAARTLGFRYVFNKGDAVESYETHEYGGPERPLLAAWFLWNLWFDPTFGNGTNLPSIP